METMKALYPEQYPEGPKCCTDCKHLKTKIPVLNGKIMYEKSKPAKCDLGMLLREDEKTQTIHEAQYKMHRYFWTQKHHDFRFANKCPDFLDMNDAC